MDREWCTRLISITTISLNHDGFGLRVGLVKKTKKMGIYLQKAEALSFSKSITSTQVSLNKLISILRLVRIPDPQPGRFPGGGHYGFLAAALHHPLRSATRGHLAVLLRVLLFRIYAGKGYEKAGIKKPCLKGISSADRRATGERKKGFRRYP